jgi:hypothetical protein
LKQKVLEPGLANFEFAALLKQVPILGDQDGFRKAFSDLKPRHKQ